MKQSRWWLSAPVLVAPDKFKGTLSAAEVADAIVAGLRAGGRTAEALPVADGGEGTADALLTAMGGEWNDADARDALGRPVRARFALLSDGTAVVEAAAAGGLWRIEERERDAWAASSRGTGELIAAASEAGARTVIVAVGGTASTDGGAGALEALAEADVRAKLVCACDVRTPWERAAAVFGPQKGADAEMTKRLARRMSTMAARLPRDPRGIPMSGAGGGMAGGLYAGAGAKLVPGAPFVLDALGFDERMRRSAFVVTGEGQIDEQTLEGKAAGEVAVRCRQAGVACHAMVGRDRLDDFGVRILALDSLTEAGDQEALRAGAKALA